MSGVGIHKNIFTSDTKLTLGLWVAFISSDLLWLDNGELFPVDPRAIPGPPKMSLLLEAKKHTCSYHQTMAYPCCAHGWPWLVHNVQPSSDNCSFKTWTGLSAGQMLCRGKFRFAQQTVFKFTWCLRKSFLLTQRFGTAWAIYMAADRGQLPMDVILVTCTRS